MKGFAMGKELYDNTPRPVRPADYSDRQLSIIKRTVAADCNNDEFNLFIEVARRHGLDPFRRQVYAIVYNKDKKDKRKMSIVTGIDGFRAVASRSGTYRPGDEPDVVLNPDEVDPKTNPLGIEYAEATIFKLAPDGKFYEVRAKAYWSEYAPLKEEWANTGEVWADSGKPKKRPTGKYTLDRGMWVKMPRVMIAKCAEAKAIRKGWPEDLSGIYAPEEVSRTLDDADAVDRVTQFQEDERKRKLSGGAEGIAFCMKYGAPIEFIEPGALADRLAERVGEIAVPDDLDYFLVSNRESLRHFWAHSPNDAIEVKKLIEKKAAEIGYQLK